LNISYQQQQLFFQTLPIVRQIRLSSNKRPEGGSLFFMIDKRLKLNQRLQNSGCFLQNYRRFSATAPTQKAGFNVPQTHLW
jgi:hypothetical protein